MDGLGLEHLLEGGSEGSGGEEEEGGEGGGGGGGADRPATVEKEYLDASHKLSPMARTKVKIFNSLYICCIK